MRSLSPSNMADSFAITVADANTPSAVVDALSFVVIDSVAIVFAVAIDAGQCVCC